MHDHDAPHDAELEPPRADSSGGALPVTLAGGDQPLTAEQMREALRRYRDLQQVIDEAMPDQIMVIVDKKFRKKGYWRAVALAMQVTVEATDERREVSGHFDDGRENFGYHVTCTARSTGGREAVGDGSCFAVEKAPRFRCPHPEPGNPRRTVHYPAYNCPDFDRNYQWRVLPSDATDHNVRAHAYTRAYNRAISNLVAFGEISFEEVDAADGEAAGQSSAPPKRGGYQRPQSKSGRAPKGSTPNGSARTITEPQQKRLYAIARQAGWDDEGLRDWLGAQGYESSAEIPMAMYDRLVGQVQAEAPAA